MTPAPPARAASAMLMTRWWSRPTAAEVAAWAELWRQARQAGEALGVGVADVEALRAAAAQSSPDALLDEYERLLVGPGRVPCAPYESMWRTDVPEHQRDSLMGPSADAVSRVYGDLGLAPRSDAHELPDHLLLEWEALAYAIEQGAQDAGESLLGDHLACWMSPFCAAVAAETAVPYYATLARLTPAWTVALGP